MMTGSFLWRMRLAGAALLSILLAIPTIAQAQNAQALVNMFGGMIGAAMLQQAREQWSRLPPSEASCLQQGLARHGISYSAVLRAGIPPSDPRFADVRAVCDRITERPLRQNVDCPISTPQGQFSSRCDEAYVIERPQGSEMKVSEEDAVASVFSNTPATIGLFERGDARSRRLEMIADGITSGDVSEPSFDCDKAHTSTEVAICNSYELSRRDAEYAHLYKRARRFNKRGKVHHAARSFYRRARACEGDKNCLGKLQVAEIDYMANVLRKHGETVVTSIERDQQQKAQRQAQLELQQKQQAAAAAAARQRAQALAATTATAKSLLLDAAAFLKSDQSNPRALTMAEAIASLNASLKVGDPGKIKADTASLSKIVHDDPNFEKYLAARSAQAAKENAQHLADAVALANRQKAFLISQIAEAPTSDLAIKAIAYVKHLRDAVSSPDLSQLQSLTDEIDAMLRAHNLEQSYLAYQPAKPSKMHPSHVKAVFAITTTDKTRFVTTGALDDIVLLYNSSPKSPHVVRNLRGDIVFDGGVASACFYQPNADGQLIGILRKSLARYKLKRLLIDPSECNDNRILTNDVIAFRRGDFLQNKSQYALELIKQVQAEKFEKLVTISAKSLTTVNSATDAKRRQLADDIRSGAVSGYGVVVVESVGGANVCSVAKQNNAAHRRIQKQMSTHLAGALGASPVFISRDTIESAYEAVQRHQCGAIYASAKDLASVLPALKRERATFYVDEDWISEKQVNLVVDAIAKEAAERQVAEKNRVRAHKENAELAALQQEKINKSLAARQSALHAKYGAIADATASAVAKDLKCITTAGCDSADATREFPEFAAWFAGKMKDQWGLMTFNSSVDDYGTVIWKGRTLTAGLVEVNLRLRNRVLGEYKDACFIAGRIVDSEFSMMRDPD